MTSRQAPKTLWVDQATPRAVHAFGIRDTSAYPHQCVLDHGDLVDNYREQFENKTLPADCIGRKGAGGDYFPTEQQVADIFAHVLSGKERAYRVKHAGSLCAVVSHASSALGKLCARTAGVTENLFAAMLCLDRG